MPLQHLFDAELTYCTEMAPLAEHGEGQLIGSGDGTVRGQRVRGTLRWTLFEGPGELVCRMNPTLAVRTDDGASIGIEARSYGHRASPTSQVWRVAATLLFSADDGSYTWLDGALGVWQGPGVAARPNWPAARDARAARRRLARSAGLAAAVTRSCRACGGQGPSPLSGDPDTRARWYLAGGHARPANGVFVETRREESVVSSIRDDYERAIKLYNAGDLDGLANEYAEDAVLVTPDGTAKGRAAIRAQWAREKVGCPDRIVTPDLVFEQGDVIVTEFTWTATLTGPWVLADGTELAPTGKRMEIRGMDLTQMRDGKVAVHRMYWDNMEAVRQAGLLP